MKQLLVFTRKEFYHVFRDRRTLLILFGLPIVQIILYGFALSSEVKNLTLLVVDNARDIHTEQIITKIASGTYFKIQHAALSYAEIEASFKQGNINCAVVFPTGFGNDLQNGNAAQIQIIADASDPNTAKTAVNYLTMMVNDYQQALNRTTSLPYRIVPEARMLYNENMNGSMSFIPGVIALIFMIVCTTLTSVSVVREKELGTMEILLVSPFKPILVLIAKAVPYLALSMINLVVIMLLSVFVLDVPIRGNLILLFAESTLFIITCLSLGLLISNAVSTQQTAMLASMMGMMLPTLLFTGFMFPLENLPAGIRWISNIIPARWYYLIVKSVMLKGLGFAAVWKETLILIGMTVLLLGIALRNFKTRLA